MIKFFDQRQLRTIDGETLSINAYYSLVCEHANSDKKSANIEQIWIHNGMIGLSVIVPTKFCIYTFNFYDEVIDIAYNMQKYVVFEKDFIDLLMKIFKENIFMSKELTDLIKVVKISSTYKEICKSFNRENGVFYNGL